MVFTLTKSRN